jgi:hypothetical protein
MWQTLPKQSVFVRSIVLVIYEIILFAGITPFLWIFGTAWSYAAAGAAAGLCMTGAMSAIWIGHVLRDPKFAMTALMLGMAVNMFVPLVSGTVIQLCGGPLSESGFIYYLVFFYLMTLAMKTFLMLPVCRQIESGE